MPHPPSIVTPPIMCSSGAAGLAPPILSGFSCSSILVGVGWLITTSQTQQVELPLKPTMSPRCAAALGNQLGSRAQSQCDWVDWRAEKRLLINSRAHICSCQHIICQELGAPFASTSVFFYSISAQHGQNHRNRDFYGWFLCAVFRFRFFVVSRRRRRRCCCCHAGCKSPQQQLAVATSASTTSTIANRQRHQLGARLACISFLLRLHLTLFCCPRLSDCLAVCQSVVLPAISLSLCLPLSFSLLFSCLAVDHLSSFYGAHVLCPRFTSCLTFNSRPSPEKQQQ